MWRMTERIYYVIRRMGPQGVETRLAPGTGYGPGKLTAKTGACTFSTEEMCELLRTWGPRAGYAVPIRVKEVPALWEAVVTDCKKFGKKFGWSVGQKDVGTKKACEARAQRIREARPCCTVEVRRVKRS